MPWRMVNYKCEMCKNETEELFKPDEDKPMFLKERCSKCGKRMKIFDMKSNSQAKVTSGTDMPSVGELAELSHR